MSCKMLFILVLHCLWLSVSDGDFMSFLIIFCFFCLQDYVNGLCHVFTHWATLYRIMHYIIKVFSGTKLFTGDPLNPVSLDIWTGLVCAALLDWSTNLQDYVFISIKHMQQSVIHFLFWDISIRTSINFLSNSSLPFGSELVWIILGDPWPLLFRTALFLNHFWWISTTADWEYPTSSLDLF